MGSVLLHILFICIFTIFVYDWRSLLKENASVSYLNLDKSNNLAFWLSVIQ